MDLFSQFFYEEPENDAYSLALICLGFFEFWNLDAECTVLGRHISHLDKDFNFVVNSVIKY